MIGQNLPVQAICNVIPVKMENWLLMLVPLVMTVAHAQKMMCVCPLECVKDKKISVQLFLVTKS
ncbi:MAG: hypothetical protein D3916_15325 [Candidatus Electrothrix sp. MAN1_4]|nr:hypothetical protein [Candidatus Electrothrix sp. MAN1_4]